MFKVILETFEKSWSDRFLSNFSLKKLFLTSFFVSFSFTSVKLDTLKKSDKIMQKIKEKL